ncbi:unnamed protein product [Larinioides sclopetarius]|uniref:Uncharacterized protein n=1 Tax=Larinioides sclopetarius TaxID=280406 RepID=A0AAV1ZBJ3_9ARAC
MAHVYTLRSPFNPVSRKYSQITIIYFEKLH